MDSRRQVFWLFATLKMRGELARVNFRKDFWDCYWRVPSNDPRNNCGTHAYCKARQQERRNFWYMTK